MAPDPDRCSLHISHYMPIADIKGKCSMRVLLHSDTYCTLPSVFKHRLGFQGNEIDSNEVVIKVAEEEGRDIGRDCTQEITNLRGQLWLWQQGRIFSSRSGEFLNANNWISTLRYFPKFKRESRFCPYLTGWLDINPTKFSREWNQFEGTCDKGSGGGSDIDSDCTQEITNIRGYLYYDFFNTTIEILRNNK